MSAAARGARPPIDADAALLPLLAAGDAGAREQLVRRYGASLLGLCRQLVAAPAAAAEVLQQAFRCVFAAVVVGEVELPLADSLRAACVDAAMVRAEAEGDDTAAIEALLPTFLADGHRCDPGSTWGVDVLGGPGGAALLQRQLARLPMRHRTALVLCDVEGLAAGEVAHLLGSDVASLRRDLHLARRALRELVARELRISG